MTQNLATNESALVFSQEMPEYIDKTSNLGSENVGAKEMTIPRLELAQKDSPCLDESNPVYIPGAKPGTMYNSVTRELYGDSVYIVPVYFIVQYIIWKNRNDGGGLRGNWPDLKTAQIELAKLEDGNKCEIVKTNTHYCLCLNVNGIYSKAEEIVLSMSKSKGWVSKQLNSLIRIAGGDSFSRAYKLGTVLETNKVGQKYYNFSISPAGYVPKEIYDQARKLYDIVTTEKTNIDQTYDMGHDQPMGMDDVPF